MPFAGATVPREVIFLNGTQKKTELDLKKNVNLTHILTSRLDTFVVHQKRKRLNKKKQLPPPTS
jgi:hypothetical protein